MHHPKLKLDRSCTSRVNSSAWLLKYWKSGVMHVWPTQPCQLHNTVISSDDPLPKGNLVLILIIAHAWMSFTSPTHLSSIPNYFSEGMASALWVTLLVELLLKVNHGSSVVSGDEDQLLCENLRSIGAAPIPSYSANIRVLMDSWNYQNLLPDRAGAVWDQVDNDTNNNFLATTNVITI